VKAENSTLDWHRLFGLALTDLFAGSAYEVQLEVDLSLSRQLLDVIIIERESGEPLSEVPDGLDDLGSHNLLTYKSMHQPLDAWAIDELVGHFVNYRKARRLPDGRLRSEDEFRLYGVCTRHPEKLAREVELTPVREGVYETHWGVRRVRVIVLSEVPQVARNALWQLFSAIPERVEYGTSHYHWRLPGLSTTVGWLYQRYRQEGFAMPFTVQDYEKILKREALKMMTPEERVRGLSLEERIRGVSLEELQALLRRLYPEEDSNKQ